MNDGQIVEMYWKRDENAIHETETKYEKYLSKIAYNILADIEDCKEIVNETYFRTWNSIPTNRPTVLSTYLGKITRQLSIDRYRTRNRKKRQASEYTISIEELSECVSGKETVEEVADSNMLVGTIHSFLMSLSKENRVVFVCRYYYLDSIKDISEYTGFSESKIKTMLHRTRNNLKDYLCQEGYVL